LAEFEVRNGDAQATFGNSKEIVLQTGSTAGSLVLTAEMAGFRAESTISIPPAPAVLDALSAFKRVASLEMTVTGFDNSRSMAEVTFTFYDTNGVVIDPGAIHSPVMTAFDNYFRTAIAGGMFSMRAVFPVTGNTRNIDQVEIEVRNGIGVSRTQ